MANDMNETQQEKETQKTTENSISDSKEGSNNEKFNLVERASIERQKLEETLKSLREERAALEELKARDILGGNSNGRGQEEKPKEVDAREYAKAVLSGKIAVKD